MTVLSFDPDKQFIAIVSFVLAVISTGCENTNIRTNQEPAAVYHAILEHRHTYPAQALAEAKEAYHAAKLKQFPTSWEQRFRVLYADIFIEQTNPLQGNDLSEVSNLLAFSPQNTETEARQWATQAYLEFRKSHRDLHSSKALNEKALARSAAINDHCWRVEVLLVYTQSLINLHDGGVIDSLAQSEVESRLCSDTYWTAAVATANGNFDLSGFRYEEAKTSYELALTLAESGKFSVLIVKARDNVALAYTSLGDFNKGLSLLKRTEGLNESDKAHELSIQGAIHHLQGNLGAARLDYQRAVEILKKWKPDEYYADLEELSGVLIELNRPEEADAYNREVIQNGGTTASNWIMPSAKVNAASIARLRGQLPSAYDQLRKLNVSLKNEQDAQIKWQIHSELAQTLAALGRNQSAEREFQTAVTTAGDVRKEITKDQERMTFSAYVAMFVTHYIDFRIKQHDRPEASLQLAEEFRAQRLAEKLHSAETFKPEQFRRIARDRQAVILSYWITQTSSYVWATDAQHSVVVALTGTEATLERDIKNYNTEIYAQRALLDAPKSSADLYQKLVAPVEYMIPAGANVIIVPDGPLAALNFETLIPPAKPARFWLESVSVTVAPSLVVLGKDKAPHSNAPRFLLVGGTIPKGNEFLPGSVRELEDIQQLFPAMQKLQLKGQDATPKRFLDSKPGDFSLLHISAHGFANKDSPLDSYIVLSPDETRPTGYLYAHDLKDLRLNEDLVTLSACGGASGRSLPGEGLVGLTWAILSAGARNVVAGLWDVSDHGTADFMKKFYTYLKLGEKPAQALHDAKLAMLKQKTLPYYWAAFQLYSR